MKLLQWLLLSLLAVADSSLQKNVARYEWQQQRQGQQQALRLRTITTHAIVLALQPQLLSRLPLLILLMPYRPWRCAPHVLQTQPTTQLGLDHLKHLCTTMRGDTMHTSYNLSHHSLASHIRRFSHTGSTSFWFLTADSWGWPKRLTALFQNASTESRCLGTQTIIKHSCRTIADGCHLFLNESRILRSM